MQICQISASSSLRFLRRRILNIFSKMYPLCRPVNQSNQAILTKNARNMKDYSINISVIKNNQISPMTGQKSSISTFPIISLWKL